MSRVKASTSKKIKQRVKELTAPPGRERIERLVLEVTDSTVTYLKKSGPVVCQLSTFQRLYAECGSGIIEGEAEKA